MYIYTYIYIYIYTYIYIYQVSKIVSAAKAFDVSLDSIGVFEHGVSTMLWARPSAQASASMRWLHRALLREFPHSLPQRAASAASMGGDEEWGLGEISAANGFTPHLCLGQWKSHAEALEALQALSASWKSVSFRVSSVYILHSCAGSDANETSSYLSSSSSPASASASDSKQDSIDTFSAAALKDAGMTFAGHVCRVLACACVGDACVHARTHARTHIHTCTRAEGKGR